MKNKQNPESNPMRLRSRQRGSLKFKTRLVIALASTMLFTIGAAVVYFNLGVSHETKAAVSGDYRSRTSGSWNVPGTWEKYNGTIWETALTSPTSANGVITIQASHIINITANTGADQLLVESGAMLNIILGTLTIANGSGGDFNISGMATQITGGTLSIAAGALVTVLNGGTYSHNGGARTLTGWAVNNGGTYIHNVNNVNLPTATWGASSTLRITGVTTSDLKGMSQTFGNIIYNCTSQTAGIEFWETVIAIAGNVTVQSTGSGSTFLQKASTAIPLNIGGNYWQTGGTIYMTKGASFSCNLQGTFTLDGGTFVEVERYGLPVLNVYGLFTINNGTFNHSTYNSSLANEGIGTVNLFNNYLRTGGLHTETATLTGRGEYNFAKTGLQTFVHTGGTITNTVNFTVNSGSIVDLVEYTVTGGGSFTLSSGGGLILGSVNGITASGASGNVQVTGTRNFSTDGDYTYNANAPQVTGNGLPATVRNLTIDNPNNLTLTESSSATSFLTFTNGKVITGTKELGSANTNPAGMVNYTNTKYVVGNLRRSVNASGSYDFPVGTMTNYELANIALTSMSGFSNILGSFTNADPLEGSYPLSGITTNGTPVVEILNYGYWTLSPNSSMSAGNYKVTLKEKGHTNPSSDPLEYCVIKRPNTGSPWASLGTHTNDTQSETDGIATASRSDLNEFSHFAIGKGNGPLPVTLITFNAKISGAAVLCSWKTVAEVNNDYFTLQRSKDGKNFEDAGRVKGAGSSNNGHNYSYPDRNPYNGTSYYRLKQTDYDGTTTMFQTIRVKRDGNVSAEKILQVQPNPVQDEFSVQFAAEESGEAIIQIASMNGVTIINEKVVFEEGTNSYPLNFPSGSKTGTYVLRVINDNLALPAVKVIKK